MVELMFSIIYSVNLNSPHPAPVMVNTNYNGIYSINMGEIPRRRTQMPLYTQ